MFNLSYTRRGKLLMRYERAVRAYRAAVHMLVESRGSEFKKANIEADRLYEECETARDALRRYAHQQ
jgi:hypothetical protein